MNVFFGDRKISAITPGHIEEYRMARLAEPDARDEKSPLSLGTVNREVTMIRAMLAKAVRWGYIAKNPADRVEDYEEAAPCERFLSREEVRQLLRATKATRSPLLRPAVYLGLETGMRKGELLALRWTDVNCEASKILVPDSKTGEPRHVPMSRRARWLLSKLAARDPLSEWVFESRNEKGERSPARDTKTAWHRALRIAKIGDFRFHDLRHTFASHFAMKGGNLYALAKILGHSSPKMTLDRYTHLSPEFVNEQRRVMDASYSRVANGH